ncbi:LysR family transcriptional regulator [Bowmanella denitrificans]|uniref:LysR family transcriptional regulator n=1 Tax=Bowmanella denitrificans TaxID=366582 RepID=UPI000C9C51BC|nr:LysR family transcriptional regulator [Bowmanella denitrificans]
MNRLDDLQMFVEAARQGSLSAAARLLGRTPAVASVSLKRLETQLRVKLVERNTRNLRLTPEGQLFHDKIAQGLSLLEDAQYVVHHDCAEIGGEIRLTASVDLARQWLIPLMDEFQSAHPQVYFTLLAGDVVRDLVSEPLDLALRYGELPDSALVARRLLDNRRVLVASRSYVDSHPPLQHPQDLLNHNCLIFQSQERAYRRWAFHQGSDAVVVEVKGDRVCNDGSFVREWALLGRGIAYKSHLDVYQDLQAGNLLQLLPDWLGDSAPLSAVYPGTGPRPPRVKRFVEFLAERFKTL